MPSRMVLVLLTLTLAPLAARGENWPQWRGPRGDCVVPGKGYPTSWGEEENIAWRVKLPGWGTSTPAIWEDHIFVTCADEEKQKNALICLDRQGQQQWRVEFGPCQTSRNNKASAANPSPVTDGKHVWAYYKSGDLACVDFDGNVVWQLNLQEKYGPDRLLWDLGTSPVLAGDLVIVAVMHQGPSYLVALRKSSGEEAWKKSRDLGAPGEARDSYTTPQVVEEDGRQLLIVLGADHVTAHDAATGEEGWRVGGLNPDRRGNFREIASHVVAGEMVLAPYARGRTLTAIRRGGRGDVTASHVAWTAAGAADVPSVTAYAGRAYVCGDRGDVTCLDIKTGERLWTERLPRNRYVYSSSPVIADGKLYCTREDGTTFVLQLADEPELVATNALRENTYATPAFADGQIFLRTSDYLFCIGKR